MSTIHPQGQHHDQRQTRRYRHSRLSLLKIAALTILGNTALLSIPLFTLFTLNLSVSLFASASTPLEWLAMEICAGISILGIVACWGLLFNRPAHPEGLALTAQQMPELFAMIKRRSNQFRLNTIDQVLLTQSPGIKLTITAKHGVPGAYVQTLQIGWPSLAFLCFKQFRIVLGTTIGQWGGTAIWSTGSVCRQNAFWQSLKNHYCEQRIPVGWLLRKPISIFADFYQKHAKEIYSSQPFEKDQLALDVSDDEQTLSLIAIDLLTEAFLDKHYWPMIFSAAQRTEEPVVKPFTNLNAIMHRTVHKDDAQRWILQALADQKSLEHCSPRERLAMLGYNQLHWEGLPSHSALEGLFGCQWQALATQLDNDWQKSVRQEWQQRHLKFRQDQDQFHALQKQAASQKPVTGATALRYIRLAKQFLAKDEVALLCKNLLQVNRTHAEVCFQCGKELLSAGVDDGIRAIEIAIQLDPNYTSQGNMLINQFERTNRVVSFRQRALRA